tara:strand:+ start:422 stop:727 length:306 start_codon:yes stop_codon:yes gene_type:complete
MNEIERIQKDLNEKYTSKRLNNSKGQHIQMLNDIKYLLSQAKNNDVALDIVMLSYIKKLCKEYNKKPEQIVLNIDDESKTIDAYFVDNKSKIYHLDSKTYN